MRYRIVELKEEHARKVLGLGSGNSVIIPEKVSFEDLLRAYKTIGSVSICVLCDETPILIGGIINQGWNRGEAWAAATKDTGRHFMTVYRIICSVLVNLAHEHGFHRVQAVSFGVGDKLIRLLGFSFEGNLTHYGPNGEDAKLYARIF